jgi:peptide/nickel transport system permease protein
MWWKFRPPPHRGAAALVLALVLRLDADQRVHRALQPAHARHDAHLRAAAATRFFHEGSFVGPFVYGYDMKLNCRQLSASTRRSGEGPALRFFCRGDEYRFWQLSRPSFHFFCPAQGGTLYLSAPTAWAGRLFRIVYGTRISLTWASSASRELPHRPHLGGISGYYGGWIDNVIQRFIEMVRSFPSCRCGWRSRRRCR